jgi:hypothetical protein
MDEIYRLLYQDLRDRAGIDLYQVLQVEDAVTQGINPARAEGTIALSWGAGGWQLRLPLDRIHSLTNVVLPNPAGAETSVNFLRKPASRRSINRGRWTKS